MKETVVGKAMGTFLSVTSYEGKAQEADALVRSIFHQVEMTASRFLSSSEVSRITQAAGDHPVSISPLCRSLLFDSLRQAAFTGGIFDPTVGALTRLWNVGQPEEIIPVREKQEKARSLVSYLDLIVKGETAFLKRAGMALDLGGMAKEYALHLAAKRASFSSMGAMMIDAGGDMALIGKKPDGTSWRMGIQHPRRKDTLAASVVMTEWDTIETSGDYRRFLARDGIFQSHIFQLKEESTSLISATLIYQRGEVMLPITGTACIAGGLARVVSWLEHLPGVEGIFITEGREVYVTEGISSVTKVLTKDLTRKALILHRAG